MDFGKIYNESKRALGRTVNVVYDYTAGKSAPMPSEWRAKIESCERGAP
jgi:acyl-CoA thioesterase FadM